MLLTNELLQRYFQGIYLDFTNTILNPPCSSHVLSQAPPMFSTPVRNPGMSKFLAGGETHPHPLSGENPDARTPTLPNIHQQLTQCSSIL